MMLFAAALLDHLRGRLSLPKPGMTRIMRLVTAWRWIPILSLLAGALRGDDGPHFFREHAGVAVEDSLPLPVEFSEQELVWRQNLLPGNSTPCVVGERVFVTTFDQQRSELATVCIDRPTGAILWSKVVPADEIEPYHPVGSPASCTPACDGDRLYVFFGSYGLLCYDLEGGLLWSRRMGPFQDEFGASSSPILVDELVVLNQDHDVESFLIALDKHDGQTVWRIPRIDATRSYSTPVVRRVGDETQIVVAGALQLAGYDLRDGRKVWWINGLSRILDTTPIVHNDSIIVASWTPGGDTTNRISMQVFADALAEFDNNKDGQITRQELPKGPVLERFYRMDLDQSGGLSETEWNKYAEVFRRAQNVAIAVRPEGQGDLTQSSRQWIYRRGLPTVPSPLLYREAVYMVKDGGIITALDVKTGELIKRGRARAAENYYASPVGGDGKVYLVSEQGVATILQASRPWEILAAHDFGGRVMASPVIASGEFYLRTDNALSCYRCKSP